MEDIDQMFGSFNPTAASAKQANNANGNKKRPAITQLDQLEKSVKKGKEEEEVVDLDADVEYDGGEQEDAKLTAEGLAMLTRIEAENVYEPGSHRFGYDPADFVAQTFEFENCTHEYVAPKGYERPKDFKRPKIKPKQYKFTLDKF